MRSQSIVLSLAFPTMSTIVVNAFSPLNNIHIGSKTQRWILPSLQSTPSSTTTVETTPSFIDTELRGAAMKLHTKSQAPKEGEAPEEQPKTKQEPYVPTHMDYLKFLIDSQYVYQTFESILESSTTASLQPFQNTGLERSIPLEKDITFMTKEYNLERPAVGEKGLMYGEMIKDIMKKGDEGIPEFMCHYYNYYFAHTAGGRMIGKQMAALLLDKKTLEFYKVCSNQ